MCRILPPQGNNFHFCIFPSRLYPDVCRVLHNYHRSTYAFQLYIFSFYSSSSSTLVAKSCRTLATPWTGLPGSSVHGTLQARILEWKAILFSRGSSWPRDWTWVSHIAGTRLTLWAKLGDKYLNSDTRMISFKNPVNLDLLPDRVPIKKESGSKGIKSKYREKPSQHYRENGV